MRRILGCSFSCKEDASWKRLSQDLGNCKKWYGEGGYCPWSPHPIHSLRQRALSFRAVASPLSLCEG